MYAIPYTILHTTVSAINPIDLNVGQLDWLVLPAPLRNNVY